MLRTIRSEMAPAGSNRCVNVEGDHYCVCFPGHDSARVLQSGQRADCARVYGFASHCVIKVNGKSDGCAVRFFRDPEPAAMSIRGDDALPSNEPQARTAR